MKKWPETSPEVHNTLINGAFVGWRADGHHNGVSPDMLREQTYNADAKEESGLDGITLNVAAWKKWVYTKYVCCLQMIQVDAPNKLCQSTP